MARDERTEADITIPGMRTSLFIVFAVRSRNCNMLRPEVMRICILGMEVVDVSGFSSLERGYKMARAALVADDSNCCVDCEL